MTRVQSLLAGVLLCALGIIAYANSFSVPFHFDDEIHITENPYLWQMTALRPSLLLRVMLQDGKQNRPFSNLSFGLNYYVHQERVWGYHLINLLGHLFAGLMVFLALRLLLRRSDAPPKRCDGAALAVAAIWIVHPIHTQAVTYIVQRQTVMAGAFVLAGFSAYLYGRQSASRAPRYLLYLVALAAMILAAGSKETALAAPALLWLMEFFFFQNFSGAFIRRHPVVLLATFVILGITALLLLRPEMWEKIIGGWQNYPFTLSERLLTQPRVLFAYLSLILIPLPSHLSLEHDPAISTSWFHPWTTLPAILAWLILIWTAIRFARQKPLLSFALAWYLVNLFLESSFLPLDLMNEHRLYLPSLTLIGLVAGWPVLRGRGLRLPLAGISLLLILLIAATHSRNRVWQSPRRLWSDAVDKAPGLARAWTNLCAAEVREADYSAALKSCRRAITLDPALAEPHNYLGIAYSQLRDPKRGEAEFQTAIRLKPDLDQARFNLAELYRQEGELEKALAVYQETLSVNPEHYRARLHLGHLYRLQNQPRRAIPHYQALLRLRPDWPRAYLYLAQAYLEAGDCPAARRTAEQGLELDPAQAELDALRRQCASPR